MANRIKPKRSLTGAKVPDNLEQHELAINVPDKKVYIGGVAGAAILIADYNHAPNPFDQTLNKASSVTFSTVTNGAITLVNVKGDSGQYFTSNGDGTTKWSTPSAGQTLVDGNKTLQYGINQDNTIYFPAATVGANGSAIRTATNEPFSILSYNDTGAGTLYKFQFQNSGITFPDKTTQTTAFVGTATSAEGLSKTLAIASGGTGVTSGTGTGSVVLNTNPTFVTPILGTPQSGNLANCTFPIFNQNTTGTASKATTVTTNANLTGIVTSVGNATSIANGAIGNALLANAAVANLSGVNTGDNAPNSLYSGLLNNVTHTGDVTDTSGVLQVTKINNVLLAGLTTGILKNTTTSGVPSIAVAADFPILNQNTTGTANMLGKGIILPVDSGGTGTNYAVGSGGVVLHINAGLITPFLGTPQSGDLKNCTFPILNQNTTGTSSKATTVTTNANLTGIVTSIGNATAIAAGAIGNSLLANAAVANLSGTNSGDNATNTLYSSLVSNVTHTGDATGATALTVVKINGTLLSGLATGILKNTTATGVPSIAVAADFPTLNQNTTGSAAVATALGKNVIVSVDNGGTGVQSRTGTGSVVLNISPTLVTPILGTPQSGDLKNCVFPILNQSTSGNAAGLSATLAVAKGGTGLAAVGASGNVLTSNGSIWQSSTPASALSIMNAVFPVGIIMPFAHLSMPILYWLECNGASVNSTNYLALHAVISNIYGGASYTGAGDRMFNLPDFRGRALVGKGQATGLGGPFRGLGESGGTEDEVLNTTQIPSHTHPIYDPGHKHSGTTDYANANHTHGTHHENGTITITGSNNGGTYNAYAQRYGINAYSQENGYAHTHTFNSANAYSNVQTTGTGGGSKHNNMMPFGVVLWCIKF